MEAGRVVSDSLRMVLEGVLPVTADSALLAREQADQYGVAQPRDLPHVAVMMQNGV